jgi:hypothetical protein
MWQKAGLFDVWMTITCLWGIAAGCAGSTAGTKTDYAGHRCVTSA